MQSKRGEGWRSLTGDATPEQVAADAERHWEGEMLRHVNQQAKKVCFRTLFPPFWPLVGSNLIKLVCL